MKKTTNRSFEDVLKELDDMMKADFKRFKKELNTLSIDQKMDQVFENSENSINLADESTYLPNLSDESTRTIDYAEDRIASGEINS